jgi:hypothetical protein
MSKPLAQCVSACVDESSEADDSKDGDKESDGPKDELAELAIAAAEKVKQDIEDAKNGKVQIDLNKKTDELVDAYLKSEDAKRRARKEELAAQALPSKDDQLAKFRGMKNVGFSPKTGLPKRWFLYDTKMGEGFSLQREVFPRAAWAVDELNKRVKERCSQEAIDNLRQDCLFWGLVLPPWCYVSHWRGSDPKIIIFKIEIRNSNFN